MLHHLDADVKDIVDGVGNIASISATRAPQDSKPWYCSRLVNEKIRAFHNECAAVPTDNDARVCYENYMNSLKKYLKSNNLCDREEYTGNIYSEWRFRECVFHLDLDQCQFLLLSISIFFEIHLTIIYFYIFRSAQEKPSRLQETKNYLVFTLLLHE